MAAIRCLLVKGDALVVSNVFHACQAMCAVSLGDEVPTVDEHFLRQDERVVYLSWWH